jgi:hypothetical protein
VFKIREPIWGGQWAPPSRRDETSEAKKREDKFGTH